MEVRWTWKIFFYQNGLDNNENETIEKTLKLCLNFRQFYTQKDHLKK